MMIKKTIMFFLLFSIYGLTIAQESMFDWMSDPNDPVMQMFMESQKKAQENTNKKSAWDFEPPPMWGGTPIEGMFVLYTKNDNIETVLLRNSANKNIKSTIANNGTSIVYTSVDDVKKAVLQFDKNGGVISSVEMVFGNRTLEDFTRIVNDTKTSYGSALSVISESPYYAAGNDFGVIGVANAKFNVFGLRGWTIDIEYVTRNVPLAGENIRELRIKESKNIVFDVR